MAEPAKADVNETTKLDRWPAERRAHRRRSGTTANGGLALAGAQSSSRNDDPPPPDRRRPIRRAHIRPMLMIAALANLFMNIIQT